MALDPKPVVLTTGTNPNPSLAPEPLIVVGGLPTKTQVAGLTPVTTPDAIDETTAIALANANKAKINAIITALKA
jgi:hypothetical protein